MSKLFEYDYNLNSGGKEYLDEIIPKDTYERMFRGKNISVLNKGRCGNGGTTGFVRYALEHNKGCLILVPNRSIVISKETNDYKDNKDVCCVYGGSGNIDRDARIVIATYDQFPRLLKTLSPGGFTRSEDIWSNEFWSGRTVIIDEYHKLVDECKFRDICHRITELIKTTDNGLVLLSATPHWGYVSLLRELVEDREVITYNINYEEERRRLIEVYDVKTRDLHSILKKMKESPKNNHVCVFYNSVTGIERVIDHIGGDDCEILCGDSNKKKLGDYYSETFHDDKKLHFMTSAFFAGQDIKTPVKQCVIIGSRESENMCVGERDIKQIVGRFREGVDGVHIFYLNRKTDMDRYQTIRSEFDKNNQCLDMMGENWKMRPATIEMRQENIRLKDTLERFDYWSSKRTLIKRLEDYGYVIKDRQVGEFDEVGKRKKLTFNDAKHKIAVGENITYDDNKYCHMIKEFMMEKGVDEMLSASRETITDWYRIRNSVGISELDLLSPDEKFRLLGLENFGKYRGSYLMSCLKYLGVTCDYDQIPYRMREELGCYTTIWKRDPKGKESSDVYMVYTKMKEWRTPPKMGMCSYKEETFDIPNSGGKSHRLSYQTEIKNKKCYGKTTSLKDAPSHYNLLKGNYLYDWVNKDKEHRLPGVKGEDRWKDIKNYGQTKISELGGVS